MLCRVEMWQTVSANRRYAVILRSWCVLRSISLLFQMNTGSLICVFFSLYNSLLINFNISPSSLFAGCHLHITHHRSRTHCYRAPLVTSFARSAHMGAIACIAKPISAVNLYAFSLCAFAFCSTSVSVRQHTGGILIRERAYRTQTQNTQQKCLSDKKGGGQKRDARARAWSGQKHQQGRRLHTTTVEI